MKLPLSAPFYCVALLTVGLLACEGQTDPDTTPPTVISQDPPPGAVSSLGEVTVTFSEPVTLVSVSDLLLNGFSAVSLSGSGDIYTFTFNQLLPGPVEVTWDIDTQITDQSEQANAFDPAGEGATWQYTLLDVTPPVVEMLNPLASAVVRTLTQVEVTFSEVATGVDPSDLLINGEPATAVTGSASGPYLFQFTQPSPGSVQIAWATTTGIEDVSVPPNAFAGGSWSYELDPNLPPSDVRINELMAANKSGLLDQSGNREDWIEIFNFDSVPVELEGWSLTDDPDDPDKWVFPAATLEPGEYLIVFASGTDLRFPNPGEPMHTNFKLAVDGEFVGLFNGESPREAISTFSYPEQRNDHSYGYDSGGELQYFDVPTPGGPNAESTILGVVPPVHFNVEHGFFDDPFTLVLSTPLEGATIRFTRDGSEPTAATGETYPGPMEIDGTTVLRAAAFRDQYLPSNVGTHSYLFLDQVMQQPPDPEGFPIGNLWGGFLADYAMDPEIVTNEVYSGRLKDALLSVPSLSIVIDTDDMFGEISGLYTHTTQRGAFWERACSAELLLPDGSEGLQVNCGIQIQGNSNRNPANTPKHAFRLLFKADYGPRRLDYQFFPDSPVTDFNTMVLRPDSANAWLHWTLGQRPRGQRVRDAWLKDTLRDMGGLATHNRFVHLYINGLYWGLYDPAERPDADFAAAYLGGEPEDYDAINQGVTEDGNLDAYLEMLTIGNLGQNSQYEQLKNYLDTTQFIDYMASHFYGAHGDWGVNKNWYALRRRAFGAGYMYMPWDCERILESPDINRVISTGVPSGLHPALMANAEYKLEFADRVHKHFFNGGALTHEANVARWMKRANEVDQAMIAESARWGDYRRDVDPRNGASPVFERDVHYLIEQARLLNDYFPVRSDIVLNQLRQVGLYPQITPPDFNQHGGDVPRGFSLTMANAQGSILYTTNGVDPRVYGLGGLSPDALFYSTSLTLGQTMTVKARSWDGLNWSALNEATFHVAEPILPIRITEIMYNPIGGDPFEYVELQYLGLTPLNIGAFSLSGVTFLFPPQTILAPGEIVLLASDSSPSAFASRYPGADVDGFYSGNLANGGEKLTLLDAAGKTVISVNYDDENGWPLTADGLGASLEIIDPLADPDDPANWQGLLVAGGSPGEVTAPSPAPSVRINELLADNVASLPNQGSFPDWVEFYNGGDLVDLGGWSLSDDGDPRKYVFPAGTMLANGAYLVVLCDSETALPGLHTGFGLNRNGESLFLYDDQTNRVDAVTFGHQLTDQTVGRIGAEPGTWQLCVPTPGGANLAASVGSVSNLVFNEWMANPVAGDDDWVELFNTHTDLPVSLQGVYLSAGDARYKLHAPAFVEPLGYLRLWADEQPGVNHLDFKLSAGGETMAILNADAEVVEEISFGAQAEGVSEGRLPDGTENIVSFPGSASPGLNNYVFNYAGPRLNELNARNEAAVEDSAERFNDYVELYNPSGTLFNLSGMRLSTDAEDADQWVMPAGLAIPANGFLAIWFDDQRPASAVVEEDLNTGVALADNGGHIYLFDAQGRVVDSVEYGFQILDRAVGKVAGGQWKLLTTSTPGSVNGAAAELEIPAGLRINEWLADPVDGEDWFEVFNLFTLPVEMGGLYVTDDMSSSARMKSRIAPLSYIDGRGFVQVIVGGGGIAAESGLAFGLDARGESVRLYDTDFSVIDSVYFGPQTEGASEGRVPDGGPGQVKFAVPTPGAPNSDVPGPPVIVNQPRSQSIDEGDDVTFEISVAGLGTITYQWYEAGTNLIIGATNSTFTLSNVQSEQQTIFSVTADNGAASVTSVDARLTVVRLPEFVQSPADLTVRAGDSVKLTVVTKGTFPMTYRWRRNGRTQITEAVNSHTHSFFITDAQLEDAGKYTVVGSNPTFFRGVLSGTGDLVVLADTDGDGVPDEWETANGMDPENPDDGAGDRNGDGITNLDEYEASLSPLQLSVVEDGSGRLEFVAVQGKSYTIESSATLGPDSWGASFEIAAEDFTRLEQVDLPLGPGTRFYRLRVE